MPQASASAPELSARWAELRTKSNQTQFNQALAAGVPVGESKSVQARSARSPDSMAKVVILGTGTPIADPARSGPSVAIVVNGTSYIVDCGAGVVRRASAAARAGIPALRPGNLRTLFVTHLHSDHTLGYPDIILTPAVLHRDAPLEVYGPPGIKAMTDHILEAYQEDINLRINGLEHGNPAGYKVNVHEIRAGIAYKDKNVTVTAFPVKHGSWQYAFGYRFETAHRTIVISGDTSPADSVAEACNGCDVLFHEVYCKAGFDKLPPIDQEYHSHFHTSTVELARVADKAKPGLLVLYHQLFFGCSEDDLLKEVTSGYKGRVASAHDLEVF